MEANQRRDFLKKSLKIGALGVVAGASVSALAKEDHQEQNVVLGKSTKEEVLYKKTMHWEKYYKIAY
ncbi:twin-arginine translocation signal domain-containing protein [Campylobacter peloridis]|uniref:Twin-arginine translocation signal domain-containing protein n=2 Tax=Campylobacter peloridis TaxID=488546 RepID=A0A5C7DLW6_9BACT|nr:twin-arginine translocation signal domain-containing protein [Campylobacter peloridis]AJC84228.1 putative formate dehydrogenase-associated protein [Campylobacter peloridis LMG 23910]MBX1885562.1 twin-arginine translocation signal domain-containing protein [Campylobacter peloridis]MBX2078845.1 twin-arginine translocation signal domain-containing protein [Campylobacter peloridis]QOQ89729.1 twin-arginine translocation signal domain-containing protein [Campylobacter peloridis]TXE78339.1 twin-ar